MRRRRERMLESLVHCTGHGTRVKVKESRMRCGGHSRGGVQRHYGWECTSPSRRGVHVRRPPLSPVCIQRILWSRKGCRRRRCRKDPRPSFAVFCCDPRFAFSAGVSQSVHIYSTHWWKGSEKNILLVKSVLQYCLKKLFGHDW